MTNFNNVNNTQSKAGVKHDEGKNRLDLIEPEFIEGIGEVLTFGAKEYGENSWQNVENGVNRYYAAAMRHLLAYRKGEKKDPESGLSHLHHVACNIMFLAHWEESSEQ